MAFALFLVVIGLAALVFGGELLVRGSVLLAVKARLSSLAIGVVVVGFGTSMPELATSVEAVLADSPQLAWGNIVGSNIANTLMILGGAALVSPFVLDGKGALRDPLVGAVAALLLLGATLFAWAGTLLGAGMLVALAIYLVVALKSERTAPVDPEFDPESADLTPSGWTKPSLLTIAGLAILIAGGQALVSGSIDLARLFGLSETVIGLTVVAIGTSLPELVASVLAARKGESELAFGNVAGSNLYNILFIGGATMVLAPEPITREMLPLDLGVMTGAALLLLVLAWAAKRVTRWMGALMVLSYAAYLATLVVLAS